MVTGRRPISIPHDDLLETIRPAATSPHLIHNFSIIARIDHSRSTLADQILQLTGVISAREIHAQYLDRMGIERGRGVTTRSQAVRMSWEVDGVAYALNMIDTPGHVDFSYGVSRSLVACERALLPADASRGIEAQTLANLYLALESDLTVIPVLSKVDLPGATPEKHVEEVAGLLRCEPTDCMMVSGKTGEGAAGLSDRIVCEVPTPGGDPTAPTRAMTFDSVYDTYRGVITYVHVVDGSLKARQKVNMMSTGTTHELLELGMISPEPVTTAGISTGEVGYLITGVKDVRQSHMSDTVTGADQPATQPLEGYCDLMPVICSGLYPIEDTDFLVLHDALGRLRLNDTSLTFEPKTSAALGSDFRYGFLGLLHPEIIRERLGHEFDLALISTTPNVECHVVREDDTEVHVHNPSEFPDGKLQKVLEPVVATTILISSGFIGSVTELCQDRRGAMKNIQYLPADRMELHYTLPLAEIVYDSFDQLKSRTRGYASLGYHLDGEAEADLVRMDISLNEEQVDAFSAIVHCGAAYSHGTAMAQKLRKLIPRQQFEVPVQTAIDTRAIARENIRTLHEDVLAKCYGGDITRKRKLLEKQKAGKKRMEAIGRIEVPREAFITALSSEEPEK